MCLHDFYTFILLLLPVCQFFCCSLSLSNALFTISCVNKPLSGSLSVSVPVLDFTSRYPYSRTGGCVAGGDRVSSSSHMNRDGAWRLLLQQLVWKSLLFMTRWTIHRKDLLFCFVFFCCTWKEVQETKSLHATKISLRPSLWRHGKKITHLSVEGLQGGTWLYKASGDWEHSLVSGSCMQTSCWEGGGSTHKAE